MSTREEDVSHAKDGLETLVPESVVPKALPVLARVVSEFGEGEI